MMKRQCLVLLCFAACITAYPQTLPEVYERLERNYERNAFYACIQMEKDVQEFTLNRFDTLASNSFFYLGDAYNHMGNLKKALLYFEREKKMLQALHMESTEDYSNSLNNLAYLYVQAGNLERAGDAADELIMNGRKVFSPTDSRFVSSVLYVCDIYLQLDRLRKIESLLSGTLRAQPERGINRALLLSKMGDVYSYTGEFTKASACLNAALDLLAEEPGEESDEYISAAVNLGVLYMNEGKYPEAEDIFDIALSNVEPSAPAYASILNNQALVLQSLGQLDRAEQALQKIKKMDSATVGTSHPDFAITLSNLGLVYADEGKLAAAKITLSRAMAIQKENGEENTLSFARKLNNLAKVYQMAGDPGAAVPILQQSLSKFRRLLGRESPEYATAAYNLGVALWKAGKPQLGYKYLKIALSIRARVLGKNHPKYAESLLKIGEYEWYRKEVLKARQSFRQVFQNYYFQIDETFPVLTEEEKSKFYYTNIRSAFDRFNSLAVTHRDDRPLLLGDAYDYVLNTKAAIMFATEKVKASINSSGDSSLIRQFDEWQASKEQIAKLYSLNQGQKKIDSLLLSANALEKELMRKSAAFAGQFTRKKYSWQQIQKKLGPGDAAVEVVRFRNYSPEKAGAFSDDIAYAFLVITPETEEHPDIVLLPNGNELESKYLRYYKNNVKYHLDDVASYEQYFAPLGRYLQEKKISRLYFSPDGVFNQINLNILQNPVTKRFLIDEMDINVITNTRELVEVATAQPSSPGRPVLIGFPKFNLGESSVTNDGHEKPGAVNRGWRGGLLRYMRGENGISQLPATEVEIGKIAALLGKQSVVYTGTEASERSAKTISSPSVLHLATHGYFLEDEDVKQRTGYVPNPLLNAGLLLAGAENFLKTGQPINDEGDDGVLTAFEAMNLRLEQCDLVVLSACETGLGDIKNGEGVYGLQRAFKLAGARNIVMSLWSVDDEATQQLMTTFYREMLKGVDRHQAFRTAQQQVRQKYPSPFYWGAFIMVGI